MLVAGVVARSTVGPAESLLTMSGNQNVCAAIYGLTLAFTPMTPITVQPHYVKGLKLGPDSVQPLCGVTENILGVSVRADSPFKTIGELVAAAKKGSLSYGSPGPNSAPFLAMDQLERDQGLKLVHVPYKGGGQASTDLVSNQVPMAVLGLAPMLAQHKNGKVRVLAVTSPKRNAALPEVPTFTEAGFPQIALTQWAGLVAPTGLPEPIARRLADEIARIVQMPDIQKKLVEGGITPQNMSGPAFDKFLKDTVSHWEQLVPTLGIKLTD